MFNFGVLRWMTSKCCTNVIHECGILLDPQIWWSNWQPQSKEGLCFPYLCKLSWVSWHYRWVEKGLEVRWKGRGEPQKRRTKLKRNQRKKGKEKKRKTQWFHSQGTKRKHGGNANELFLYL